MPGAVGGVCSRKFHNNDGDERENVETIWAARDDGGAGADRVVGRLREQL